MTTFANRLRHALDTANMKAIDLHNATGISKATISEYLSGNYEPKQRNIYKIATALNVLPSYLMGIDEPPQRPVPIEVVHDNIKIPILGSIAAGTPITAYEDILGYEYINESYKGDGYNYFALHVHGRSMEPTIHDGDTVIVRQQECVEDSKIAVVLIDGEDATVKEVKETADGIMLIGHNPAVYTPHAYTTAEIETLPVQILGQVVEIRRKLV